MPPSLSIKPNDFFPAPQSILRNLLAYARNLYKSPAKIGVRLSSHVRFLAPGYETMLACILQKLDQVVGVGPKAGKSSSPGREKIKAPAWSDLFFICYTAGVSLIMCSTP
jgi:hypothetical protein